jgi:hypothetical protein
MKCKELITFIFLPLALASVAQVKTIGYLDFGSNQSEPSVYLCSGINGSYQWNKTTAEAGFLMNLKSENDLFFSGYRFMTSREFTIKEFPFSVQAFLVQTYDEMLSETNWGFDVSKQWKHFDLTLGAFSNIYAYRNNAIEEYEIEEEAKKIKEPFNLQYLVRYKLKPSDHQWNAAVATTNFDYFLYTGETNPMFNLSGYYQVSPAIRVFTEAWFEFSGIFNINASYFGYYVRTGVIINPDKL